MSRKFSVISLLSTHFQIFRHNYGTEHYVWKTLEKKRKEEPILHATMSFVMHRSIVRGNYAATAIGKRKVYIICIKKKKGGYSYEKFNCNIFFISLFTCCCFFYLISYGKHTLYQISSLTFQKKRHQMHAKLW